MANRIQNYRGSKANIPGLKVAEFGFATDTLELFIGTSRGNINIGGSQWYTGTAMSGTVTATGYYSYSACPLVKVGDIYLNTSNGNVYQCTTAGSGTTAKWTYKGNIRGKGISSTAVTYQSGTSGTTAPTGTWSSSIPSVAAGSYLWTKVVTTYTDSTTSTAYSVARQGTDGRDGDEGMDGYNGNDGQRGSKWFTGTAMSGTSTTTGAYTWNDSEQKYVGDMYLNTTYGYVYKCTTAGTYTTAKWTYQGNIRGPQGPQGQNAYAEAWYQRSGDGIPSTITEHITYNQLVDFQSVNETYTSAKEKFVNCCFHDSGRWEYSEAEIWDYLECVSGFKDSSQDLEFVNCSFYIDATNLDSYSNAPTSITTDLNFIYTCKSYKFVNCTFYCYGNGNINIVKSGIGDFSNCQFYLTNAKHSICHYDTDTTPLGTFTGNYVEYYATYMRFGTISGNQFNHKAAGSSSANKMILMCPTCMTGNHFTGNAAYVDAQTQKVIVDRNLHDNGLTIASTASGSITTNNLQY